MVIEVLAIFRKNIILQKPRHLQPFCGSQVKHLNPDLPVYPAVIGQFPGGIGSPDLKDKASESEIKIEIFQLEGK